MQPHQTEPKKTAADTIYLGAVGGLLLLIIVLVGALWLRERSRAKAALQDLANLRAATAGHIIGPDRLQAGLHRLLEAGVPTTRPLQRDDLPSEMVNWNGRPRKVFLVGAAAGRRIGLDPGDVIEVYPAPATASATNPAE